jgi:hypothetical protein
MDCIATKYIYILYIYDMVSTQTLHKLGHDKSYLIHLIKKIQEFCKESMRCFENILFQRITPKQSDVQQVKPHSENQ